MEPRTITQPVTFRVGSLRALGPPGSERGWVAADRWCPDPSLTTCTTISLRCWTLRVGPGMEMVPLWPSTASHCRSRVCRSPSSTDLATRPGHAGAAHHRPVPPLRRAHHRGRPPARRRPRRVGVRTRPAPRRPRTITARADHPLGGLSPTRALPGRAQITLAGQSSALSSVHGSGGRSTLVVGDLGRFHSGRHRCIIRQKGGETDAQPAARSARAHRTPAAHRHRPVPCPVAGAKPCAAQVTRRPRSPCRTA